MGRHSVSGKAPGEGAKRGRVRVGRGLLLVTGVGTVMSAGAGIAAADPGLNEGLTPNTGLTQAYREPAMNSGPALGEAPSQDQTPSLGGPSLGGALSLDREQAASELPALDGAPVDGQALVADLTGAGMRGEGSVSEDGAAVAGSSEDGEAEAGMDSGGGWATASGPGTDLASVGEFG